jgi:endo-1,4-beta-xylanase
MERAGKALLVFGVLLVVVGIVFVVLNALGIGDESTAPEQPAPPRQGAGAQPLRESAVARRMLVGAAVAEEPLREDRQYRETLAREYNEVTPENAMKWDTIHPEDDRYDFGPADAIVRFARQHDMAVRGHTLVWYRQVPSWVADRSWTRPELEQVLHDHIRKVVGHYRGKIAQWDVVNEAFDDDGELRNSVWMRVIGPEYIDLAFTWAHEADPDAKLYYNDYNLEYPGQKASAVNALVRDLQSRGIPIDGVGIQAHELTVRAPARTDMQDALQGYADLGLDVAITELDVGIDLPSSDTKRAVQANVYSDVLAACLSVSRCHTFVTWGFTDKFSWIPSEIRGFGDALPFDASYAPKPALTVLRSGLAHGRR